MVEFRVLLLVPNRDQARNKFARSLAQIQSTTIQNKKTTQMGVRFILAPHAGHELLTEVNGTNETRDVVLENCLNARV